MTTQNIGSRFNAAYVRLLTKKLTSKIRVMEKLTKMEEQSIKTLNYIATFDGILPEEYILHLLNQGIDMFIQKERRHLVRITRHTYPIKIAIVTNPK